MILTKLNCIILARKRFFVDNYFFSSTGRTEVPEVPAGREQVLNGKLSDSDSTWASSAVEAERNPCDWTVKPSPTSGADDDAVGTAAAAIKNVTL